MDNKSMTLMCERFCREYLIDFNGTKSAIRAGYSEKTADVQASRMLTRTEVQKKISELCKKVSDELEITQVEIVKQILEDRKAALKLGQTSTAMRANELLGKFVGMFNDKLNVDHSGEVSITVRDLTSK